MRQFFLGRGRRLIAIGFLVGISAYFATSAKAQNPGTPDAADLQKRVQDLEGIVEQMRAERYPAAQPLAQPETSQPNAQQLPPPPGMNPDPYVQAPANGPVAAEARAPAPDLTGAAGWKDGFFMRSNDGSFQLRITGQLQTDFRGFLTPVDTSTAANASVAGSPVTGSPDTFLIRRARLGIEATMFDYYDLRFLPDFAGSSVSKSITDAYINVHYWSEFQIETGKFKQPFSYEQLIQDRYVPFMERSMMDQLVPQRDEGVMIHGEKLLDNRLDYAIALSNGDPNDSSIDNNNSKDFNARLAVRPLNFDDGWEIFRGLQLGVSYSVGTENEALSSTSSPAIITTPATATWFAYTSGVLANGQRDRISPELEYFYHSFGFSAQYYKQDAVYQKSTASPLVDVPIEGYYVMASYLLTGEQRHEYSQQIDPINPFDPSAPICSPGAWELLFRADRLEVGKEAFAGGASALATSTGNGSSTANDRSSNAAFETTVGLNWYLNKWVRAQLNWEHSTFASPVQIGNVKNAFTEEDALYTRFQLIF